MSIGSHELVKNGEVSTIDAAPMIQDNRTFVPFRALAEAFGATVEFDATNNTVTAKLDGTTVVLTIGSSVMTHSKQHFCPILRFRSACACVESKKCIFTVKFTA